MSKNILDSTRILVRAALKKNNRRKILENCRYKATNFRKEVLE